MAYSVFDDPKLYKKPDTRNWNSKTGNGWRRNKGGDWQYYANFEAVEGKVDKSGVKDVANLGKEGWNILPTKEVEPIPQRPHNWFDSAPKTDAYASQPGTGQFIRLPEDMQTTTAEDRGNLATIQAVQNTDIANQKSIGANKARASWLKATSNSPAAKAFGDSKEANDMRWNLQQEHRKWKAERSPQVEQKDAATPGVPTLPEKPPLAGVEPKFSLEQGKWVIPGQAALNNQATPNAQASSAGLSGADMAAGLGKVLQMLDSKEEKKTGPIANVGSKSNKNTWLAGKGEEFYNFLA